MFASGLCRTSVTILEAIFFGTGGACIDMSMTSVYWAALVFTLAVVILKIAGKALILGLAVGLRRALAPRDTSLTAESPVSGPSPRAAPTAGDGPIRSARPR